MLEFHVHGGRAVVKAVLDAISNSVPTSAKEQIRVRYAEPGEFTRRAFYNDRLVLPQIEALGEILSAETEQQRRLAIRGTTTALTARYETWRRQLLYARGELEALIDFAEDQQFEESPAKLVESVVEQVEYLKEQIQASIANASRGELLRNGINVALLGAPNAGKSSLLNRIVGREAAIVSREAGTTRDVVDVNVDIGGYLCNLGDLAGLRGASTHREADPVKRNADSIGEVEEEGMRRAKERVLHADVVIVVLSVEPRPRCPNELTVQINTAVAETLQRCDLTRQTLLFIINKTDLVTPDSKLDISGSETLIQALNTHIPNPTHQIPPALSISCKPKPTSSIPPHAHPNPDGIQTLLKTLIRTFETMTSALTPSTNYTSPSSWQDSLGASNRQRLLLIQCLDHLTTFIISSTSTTSTTHSSSLHPKINPNTNNSHPPDDETTDIVLAAESLRSAADCLGKITGRGEAGDVEEVLGVVFEK